MAQTLIPQEVVVLVEAGQIGLDLRDREVRVTHHPQVRLKAAMVETVLVLTLVEAEAEVLLQPEQMELRPVAVPVAQEHPLLFPVAA